LAVAQFQILDSLQDASERFGQRRVAKIRLRFEAQQIFLRQPRRHDDGLRISSIEKKQVIAQILLVLSAKKAIAARRGVGNRDTVADAPLARSDRQPLARLSSHPLPIRWGEGRSEGRTN